MARTRQAIEDSLTALVDLGNLAGDTADLLERDADLEERLRAAEAKVVDIGWRKNKLIAAIEAKGFVVRWGKDGTPELLTKEEAEKRDGKPESFRYGQRYYRGILSGLTDARMMGLDFTWDTTPGAVNPLPASAPQDTLVKQEPVAAPTIYERAMKRAGLVMLPLGCRQFGYNDCPVCKFEQDKLDEALRAEMREAFPSALACNWQQCDQPQCKVWRERPWK